MNEYLRVEVSDKDGSIICIEPGLMISGRDLTPEIEQTIRDAAEHLLSFVGISHDESSPNTD
jgi:hypothetical protein